MTTHSNLPRLITIGTIAAETGSSVHRVRYVLQTRPHILPAALAGQTRLYSRDAVSKVQHELNAIAARRAFRRGVSHVR